MHLHFESMSRPSAVDRRLDPEASLVPVPQAHRFDEAALARYLRRHLQGLDGDLRVRQFHGGQSNPTFLVESGGSRLVLRKKPPGALLPSAHQIEREFRVQRALEGTGVPVPAQLLLCEDTTVIGTAFYLMAFVEGRIVRDLGDLGGALHAARMYDALTATLATLHAVDWQRIGLSDFGRPEGFLARQLDRWGRQYRAAVVGTADPLVEPLMVWLSRKLPAESTIGITHGDYRLGNLVFAPEAARVAAVLDWELCTIGDPLADLAYLCIPYHVPPDLPGVMGLQGLDLAKLGVPDESALLAAYARHGGRDAAPHWPFYKVFSFFRLAAIVQGVFARGLKGNASSDNAAGFERLASLYLSIAWSLTRNEPPAG